MKITNNIYLWLSLMAGFIILRLFYTKGDFLNDMIMIIYPEDTTSFRSLSIKSLSKIDYYSKFNVFNNIDTISSGNFSNVQLFNNKSHFTIGQTVELRIDVFDQRNRHATEGGDLLRIWGENLEIGASSTGNIIDLGNGSYIGYLKLLWTGKTNIHVMLAVTKEQVGVFLRKLTTFGITRQIQAIYFKLAGQTNFTASTFCSTIPVFPGFPHTCNFTHLNFGMPWYCGHPGSNLSCEDWKYYTEKVNNTYEKGLIRSYGYKKLNRTLTVYVTDERERLSGKPISCRDRKIQETWNEQIPTGYFLRDEWNSLYCTNQLPRDNITYINCLKHRPLQFYGDSTSRQWFEYLHRYLNLTFKIGGPYDAKDIAWHRYTSSVRNDLNISLSWAPHELPFYGHENATVLNIRSVGWYLDQIPKNSNAVIVLHWYIHLGMTTANIFRLHIQNAVKSIRKLLKRAPNSKIFIKGPHAFRESGVAFPVDFVKQYQQQILYEEFKDLRDKVIFIDEWDITASADSYRCHPSKRIIKEMVHQLMSYVCDIL